MENLIKFDEVCDRLRISKSTGRRWLSQGYLPAPIQLRDNGVLRWSEQQIADWLKEKIKPAV